MRNKYILLRHGETIYQAKGLDIFYPDDNILSLTKKGEQQIKSAVGKLKKNGVSFIYSSDFLRTKQAARIVAKELVLKINFDKRLRDVEVGDWRGKTGAEFYQVFSEKQRFSKRPKNGESWRDVKKRLKDFIRDIEKKHKNKTILIISHADPIWLLAGFMKGLTEKELLKRRDKKDLWPDVGQYLVYETRNKTMPKLS